MKKRLIKISYLFLFITYTLTGQGYEIRIEVGGLHDTTVYIGYHFGDKKFVKDTLRLDSSGKCVYAGDENLPGGVYLLVTPDMNFIEFLVGDDQVFTVRTDTGNLLKNLSFRDSEENERFLEYQHFMIDQQIQAETLRKKKEEFKDYPDSVAAVNAEMRSQDQYVKKYWAVLVEQNKGNFLGNLVKSMITPDMPEFEIDQNTDNPDSLKWVYGYLYNRDHFLDNIDFTDERLLRSPMVYSKLDQYFNKVLIQRPDSIIPQIGKIVDRARSNEDVFQYVIVFLLNNYQQSTIMGLDEVYIRIAEDYYLSGQASWADSTFIAKLQDRVTKIKPNLIGKTGKDLTMESSTGEWVSLHQVKARYTVLYFWEPNCGHCKTATPLLYELYKKYRERGVEIFAVYTQDDKEEWLNYLNENGFDWINAYDPNQATFFRYYYDVFSTPVVYLLDEEKVIVAKRISVESLGRMLENLL